MKAVYDAITTAPRYVPHAIYEATGQELHEMVAGIIPGLLLCIGVLAASTALGAAAGAAIGALAFGVGAAPGAALGGEVGFDAGSVLLGYLGLGFLVAYIGQSLWQAANVAAEGVGIAWRSVDDRGTRWGHGQRAANRLAFAVGLVFRGVLQGIVAFLLAKGGAAAASRVPELVSQLRASKLGAGFAEWVERNWKGLVKEPKLKSGEIGQGGNGAGGSVSGVATRERQMTPKSEPDSEVKPKPEELIAQRRATAENFYRQQGFEDNAIKDHLKGIDFSKPVEVTTLEPGTEVTQWQVPGRPQGNYYTPPGTDPNTLGIRAGGRVENLYVVQEPVQVLQSTAADIPAWDGSGVTYPGGGVQYFTTSKGAFGLE